MQEQDSGMRRGEKLAGVVAIIAALVVLNGAWVNQHTWQNVSWRIAVASILVMLAVIVETRLFGLLHPREHIDDAAVPEFLRAGSGTQLGEAPGSLEPEPESATTRTPGLPV